MRLGQDPSVHFEAPDAESGPLGRRSEAKTGVITEADSSDNTVRVDDEWWYSYLDLEIECADPAAGALAAAPAAAALAAGWRRITDDIFAGLVGKSVRWIADPSVALTGINVEESVLGSRADARTARVIRVDASDSTVRVSGFGDDCWYSAKDLEVEAGEVQAPSVPAAAPAAVPAPATGWRRVTLDDFASGTGKRVRLVQDPSVALTDDDTEGGPLGSRSEAKTGVITGFDSDDDTVRVEDGYWYAYLDLEIESDAVGALAAAAGSLGDSAFTSSASLYVAQRALLQRPSVADSVLEGLSSTASPTAACLLSTAVDHVASWAVCAGAVIASLSSEPAVASPLVGRLERSLALVRGARVRLSSAAAAAPSRVLAVHHVESAHPFPFGVTQTALVLLSADPRAALVRVTVSPQCGLVCAEDSVAVQPASADGSVIPWPRGYAIPPTALAGPFAGGSGGPAPPAILISAPLAPALLVTFKTAPPSANAPAANRWGVALTITEYGCSSGVAANTSSKRLGMVFMQSSVPRRASCRPSPACLTRRSDGCVRLGL